MSTTTEESVKDVSGLHLALVDGTQTGPLTPKFILIDKDEIIIGRQPDMVDVPLDCALKPNMISRIHAKLLRISANGETKIKLVDNKSTNGLIVNGIKVEEAILNQGDTVIFGGAHVKVPTGTPITKPLSDLVYTFVDPPEEPVHDAKDMELDGTQPYAEDANKSDTTNEDKTANTPPQLTPVNSASNLKESVATLQKQDTIPIASQSLRKSGSELATSSALSLQKPMSEWTVDEVAEWCTTILPNNDDLKEKIKSSNVDGKQLQTLDEQNLGETLGITKFVLKRKLSLAIKKALAQPVVQLSSSNLENSPASSEDNTPKSKEVATAIVTSTPEKKGEPSTSPLATPAMSPIKADAPDTSVDATMHYSIPEQPVNKKRKIDEAESTTDVVQPAAKRLKSSMDMSREDICRLALAAVDPVTLGRKVWLKPGVNKLDGKFLGLSDSALNNVQAWVIHSANKGFFGTTLAVVGNAPSQVLQFDSGKMISVAKGQKIQLRTGDIVYLIEERHPFMVLHLAVNESGASPASTQNPSSASILDDSKVVQPTVNNANHAPNVTSNSDQSTSTSNVNDSMIVEPNISITTVIDTNTNNNTSGQSVQEEQPQTAPSIPPPKKPEEKKDGKPAEDAQPNQKTFEERKEYVKQKILVSPIYKVLTALDIGDFVSKYGEPLTSPPSNALLDPSKVVVNKPNCYWMETAVSSTEKRKGAAACSLWINEKNKLKFKCEMCPHIKRGACTHLMLLIDMLKNEPQNFHDLDAIISKFKSTDPKKLFSHLRYFSVQSPQTFTAAERRSNVSIADSDHVDTEKVTIKISQRAWYNSLEEFFLGFDSERSQRQLPDDVVIPSFDIVLEKIKQLNSVQESVRALMGVTRVLGDYDDQMTPRGFRLVVDMIIDAYDSYFLSMDHQLRKEVLDALAAIDDDTALSSSFKKKLQASCSWEEQNLVDVLAGREVPTFTEDIEVVQYRIMTLITQERYKETESYAKHFKLPFVEAQMQAITERHAQAMETCKVSLQSAQLLSYPDVYRIMTLVDMFAETDITKSIELFVFLQPLHNIDLMNKALIISPLIAHAGLLNEEELQKVITIIKSVGFSLHQIADLFRDIVAHPCAFKTKPDLSAPSVQGKLLARECLFKPFREAKFEETRNGIDSIFAAAAHFLPESLDKIALLCFEKFEEPESLFFLITILQEKYKNKGVNAMTILELYNKCFMKISKNPTPVVDLVKQEKAAQPLPAINLSKFYEGYLKQIGELPFEQLTTKLPITTQLVASTVQDVEVLVHCASVMGKLNHPEKKIDFYLKDCAVALITAALKLISKNTTFKPQAGTLAINVTGKCNCKVCGQFQQFAHDPVQTTMNFYQSADHFRLNNMDPLMLKFFAFVESRPRGSFLTQATKLVGSYHAHVKTLVRQYETAKAKKENSLKWLMLWTYQSQVALGYISAYPSEPEINPSNLIDEMMTKVAVFIDGNTLLNVIQFFVENNEEDGAISLAQTAVAMQETSKKIEIMNFITPICMKRKGARTMLDIAAGVFALQPSMHLLAKIREYYTAAINEAKNNNKSNQDGKDGEDEDLDITNNKPAEDELPKYEDMIEKLLKGLPDSDFKLEAMTSEKLLKQAVAYLASKPTKALAFIGMCSQYGVDEKALMEAGFVPTVQSIAGTQYVPTNTILLNNLSEADPLLKPLHAFPRLWFVASLCKITKLFQLNMVTQNKFLLHMFTWLKISRKFLYDKGLLEEWDYMLYHIYALSDGNIRLAIRNDVQLRSSRGTLPDTPPDLWYLPPPQVPTTPMLIPQVPPTQGALSKGMLTKQCSRCRILLSYPSDAMQIECPQCKNRMML